MDVLLSPAGLLWLVGSLAAATLLFGTMHRRRSRLTEVLRQRVDEQQTASGFAAHSRVSSDGRGKTMPSARPESTSSDPGRSR